MLFKPKNVRRFYFYEEIGSYTERKVKSFNWHSFCCYCNIGMLRFPSCQITSALVQIFEQQMSWSTWLRIFTIMQRSPHVLMIQLCFHVSSSIQVHIQTQFMNFITYCMFTAIVSSSWCIFLYVHKHVCRKCRWQAWNVTQRKLNKLVYVVDLEHYTIVLPISSWLNWVEKNTNGSECSRKVQLDWTLVEEPCTSNSSIWW